MWRSDAGAAWSRRGRALAVALTLLLPGAASAEEGGAGPGSYVGVYTQSNSNVLEAVNVYEGITVTRVVENSPAAAAGIEPGDILLEANGVALDAPARLDDLTDSLPPGSPIRFRVERDRRVRELEVRTVARVEPPEPPASVDIPGQPSGQLRVERRRLGFEFRPADPERLRALGQSPRFGVEVRGIGEASPMRAQGIAVGDLITAIDGRPIPSPDELLAFLDGLSERRSLELTVFGVDGERREVDVPLYRPATSLLKLRIPLLLSIDRGRDTSEYSALLGAFRWTRLANGSRLRLLWLFEIETGSPDELIDVGAGS